jgi:hypothetical protein
MLAAALLLTGACATGAKFEEGLNSWIGRTDDELVRVWGAPNSTYESKGSKYLTYSRSSSTYFPGVPPSFQIYKIGNAVYANPVGGSPGEIIASQCRVTFELKSGVVASWNHAGNACVAQ